MATPFTTSCLQLACHTLYIPICVTTSTSYLKDCSVEIHRGENKLRG